MTTHNIDSQPPMPSTDALLLPGEGADVSRRAFLQYAGFGLATAALTGCSRGPVQSVLTHTVAPVGVVPGRAYWIATTCHGCPAACGVLAKCRDGRPVKLEGNELHTLSRGGLCATGQAEILSLYDSKRLGSPQVEGASVKWTESDSKLRATLDKARAAGNVRLLTGTIHSPSTRAWIAKFGAQFGDFKHVEYDALSVSAIQDAHAATHGSRALPAYRFSEAKCIASFDADFLGTWISPVSFAADWAAGRRPDEQNPHMSRHLHFEARMSVTGSAADERTRLAPWELAGALSGLCEALEHHASGPERVSGSLAQHRLQHQLEALALELWNSRGHSLVVSGSNDVAVQVLVNYANELLGNYGTTLSIARPSLQRRGSDSELEALGRELASGAVDVLIISGANPAYDLPTEVASVVTSAKTIVVHSDGLDETAALAQYRLPTAHALESWNDGEPEVGRFSLTQPTVPSLHNGRTLREILARLAGDERSEHALLEDHWRENVHGQFPGGDDFDAFFKRALHDGYVELEGAATEPVFNADAVGAASSDTPTSGLGLVLYPKVGMLAGEHAHNPWLQELPDPVTKVTWDNYACLSEARASELGVKLGDVIRITVEGGQESLELPVVVQRGQHDDVVAVALGYGRLGTDRFAGVGPDWLEGEPTIRTGETIGVNVAQLQRFINGQVRGDVGSLSIEHVGRNVTLAATQDHHTLEVPAHLAPKGGEVRDALMTTSLATYAHDPEHAIHRPHVPDADLWPDDHGKTHHHWGMAVDLSACIGCSACTVGCQAENNVPVVGRDEVSRHREMHWMRIDRYLSGTGDKVTAAYQPMFCQQCDNAPCEAVCPVLATVHSSEGLNQQVYNRCVGTRYCANTCPYKARRFNWFDYPREDRLQNQQLNPDVTVRTRGVMEKCTFCAQRIQEAKSEAARLGVPMADGDIKVACQQSCPTQAIVFGDMNDPESAVSKLSAKQRAYGVLTELNVQPSVSYLARVRNVEELEHSDSEEDHG